MVLNTQPSSTLSGVRAPVKRTIGQVLPPRWNSFLTSPLRKDVGTVGAKYLFDRTTSRLLNEPDSVNEIMEELMSGLWTLRSSSPDVWKNVVAESAAHPLRELIHQDPFSARSYNKPRGYAGDAVLIDYIYSGDAQDQDREITPLGREIFRYNYDTPACAGVRARRDLVASIIDEVCAVTDRPHILSVACGHLREASLCRSVSAGEVGRFVALDQDKLSLDVVEAEVSSRGVVPVWSSIKSLFRGDIAREHFDFIYTTGLYDYLDDRLATKLTERLFDMLASGGRLLVANFLPDLWGSGYMETFMDWKLLYRTAEQITALSSGIAESEIATRRTYTEKNGNIVFLDITRR